jgi:hypothetical protein
LGYGGTLIDSGAIVGGNGTAVAFAGTVGNNRLKLYAGAAFTGVVTAANSGNVLELASAGTAGTICGLGISFSGFGTIQVDTGARWTITNNNSIATVGNGTPATTANITLIGQYMAGQFQIQTDGAGGTTVLGPPVSGAAMALVDTHH